jgi:hypothetical protein
LMPVAATSRSSITGSRFREIAISTLTRSSLNRPGFDGDRFYWV